MAGKAYTIRTMRNIVPNVKQTLLAAHGEGEVIDVIGEIREVEKGLASLRQGAAVEFDSGQHGDEWKIVVPAPNVRSYNTPSLVNKFSKAWGATIFDTLRELIKMDVVRLEWQFKKLMNLAQQYDVTIATAQHEIVEGDDADIGVYKGRGYPSYERIE